MAGELYPQDPYSEMEMLKLENHRLKVKMDLIQAVDQVELTHTDTMEFTAQKRSGETSNLPSVIQIRSPEQHMMTEQKSSQRKEQVQSLQANLEESTRKVVDFTEEVQEQSQTEEEETAVLKQ